jgi:hypothetical protein
MLQMYHKIRALQDQSKLFSKFNTDLNVKILINSSSFKMHNIEDPEALYYKPHLI